MADEAIDETGEEIPLAPSNAAFKSIFSAFDFAGNYGKGADLGAKLPSDTESVLEGIRRGRTSEAALRSADATATAQELENQEYVDTSDERELERQAKIDNLNAEAADRKAQAAARPALAQAAALKAQSDALEIEIKNKKLKAENDKLLVQQTDLMEGRNAVTQNTEIDEPVESRIDRAERGFGKALRAGIQIPEDGPGGVKKLSVDPTIYDGLSQLYQDAAATDNPVLIKRATSLVNRFETSLAGAEASGSKAGLSIIPKIQPQAANLLAVRLGVEGAPGSGDTISGAQSAIPAPQGAAANASEAPLGADNRPVKPAAPKHDNIYYVPTKDGSLPPTVPALSDDPSAQDQDLTPGAKALHDAVGTYDSKLREQAAKIVEAEGIKDPDKITARVDTILKRWSWSPAEEKESAANQRIPDAIAPTARKAMLVNRRIQEYYNTDPAILEALAIGRTNAYKRGVKLAKENISELLGYDVDPTTAAAIDDIQKNLEGLAVSQGIAELRNQGLSSGRMLDTERELKLHSATMASPDATIEQISSALQGTAGIYQQAIEINKIEEAARTAGVTGEQKNAFIAEYKQKNPATVNGVFNGKSMPAQNLNMQNGYNFVDEKVGATNLIRGRSQSGRVLSEPPAQSSEIRNFGKVTKKDISADATEVADTEAELQPATLKQFRSIDVPDRLPNGASQSLIGRVIQAESSFRPNLTSETGAKGLMQLTNGTGRQMWKELGFPGEYDPMDPTKNVLMGTRYMNQMLKAFNGDVRLAAAAYNVGPKTVADAASKALDMQGDNSWDAVQDYLPGNRTYKVDGKEVTINLKDQATKYVDKIMGTPDENKKEYREVQLADRETAVGELPAAHQEIAKTTLTEEGVKQLNLVKGVTDPKKAQGTLIGDMANMLLEANPFAVAEAQAQLPDEETAVEGEAPRVPASASALATIQKEGDKPAPSMGDAAKKGGAMLIDSVIPGLSSLITDPGQLGAFALGISKGASFGFDDEAAAIVRQLAHGETHDEALQVVRSIQADLAQRYPGANVGGIVAGSLTGAKAIGKVGGGALKVAESIPGIGGAVTAGKNLISGGIAKAGQVISDAAGKLTKAAPAAQAAKSTTPVVENVLKALPEPVRSTSAMTRIGNAGKEGGKQAIRGAAQGGAIGFGEGEGGVENRMKSGKQGAKYGALIGGAAGTVVGAAGKVAPKATPAEEAEYAASKQLEGLSVSNAKEAVKKTVMSDSPGASIADHLLEGQISNTVGAAASEAGSAGPILNKAKKVLDNSIKGIKQRVEGITGRKYAGRKSIENFANGIKAKSDKLLAERKALADITYEETKNNLPKVKTGSAGGKPGGATALVYGANGKPTVFTGDAAITAGKVPKEVPAFVGPKVERAMLDPNVQEELLTQSTAITRGGLLPESSFDRLQAAKISLGERAAKATGLEQKNLFASQKQLAEAMYAEPKAGALYQSADEIFAKQSKAIDENKANKVLNELSKIYDDGNTKNVDKFAEKLFSYDKDTLKTLVKDLGPQNKTAIEDVTQGYLMDTLDKIGARADGSKLKLPDITKNKIPEKLEVLLGKEKTKAIIKTFKDEQAVVNTANKAIGAKSSLITPESNPSMARPGVDAARDFTQAIASGGAAVAYKSPFAGIFAAGKTISAVKNLTNYVRSNPEKAIPEINKELASIYYTDPRRGINFLDRLIKNADPKTAEKLIPIRSKYADMVEKGTDLFTGAAASVAAIEGAPDDTKPDTVEAKRQTRKAVAKTKRDKEIAEIEKRLSKRKKIVTN